MCQTLGHRERGEVGRVSRVQALQVEDPRSWPDSIGKPWKMSCRGGQLQVWALGFWLPGGRWVGGED